jgi:hypothetical protein
VLSQIWQFLGLRPFKLEQVERFKAGSYDPIPFPARDRLENYYSELNERLYALPGVNFRWPQVQTGVTGQGSGT